MSSYAELEKKIDKGLEILEKAAKPASQVGKAGTVFGREGPFSSSTPTWNNLDTTTVDRLRTLAKSYGTLDAQALSGLYGNRPKAIGWGGALRKMAGIADPKLALDPNYGPEQLEREYGIPTVQRAASYGVKDIRTGEIRKTALAEASGQAGGYVIPPQFMSELLTIAAEDSFIEPRCKILPMTTRTVDWPMLDVTTAPATGTSPYFGGILGTWQPEAASISETEPQFRNTTWTAYDLVLYTVSSNQLLADNGIGLDAMLTQLFAQAITWYKEYAFLRGNGAGSSMPLGILNAPATINVTRLTAAHFKYIDATTMMSKLHVRSWDSAVWMMHQSVLPELMQMSDYGGTAQAAQSAGMHLTWLPALGENGVGPAGMKIPRVFLNGLPVFFTEKLPQLGTTGCVVLADLSQYIIGNRLEFQIDVSPHYLFRNNQLAWRVIARCDGKPWLNNAITDSQGFTSSPFVTVTQ